jgi:hypothetical protein
MRERFSCGNKHELQTQTNSHARWRFNQKIARRHQVVTRGGVFILNVKSATFESAWYSWLQKTNGNCHNKIGIFLQFLHSVETFLREIG